MHRGHPLTRSCLTAVLLLALLLAAACAPAAPEEASATATPVAEAQDLPTATPALRPGSATPASARTPGHTTFPRPSATPVQPPPTAIRPQPTALGATPLPDGPCGSTIPVPPPTRAAPTPTPVIIVGGEEYYPGGATGVKWFVGLGTGADLKQVEREVEIAQAYNETNQDKIYLALNVITNDEAYNVLATQIERGYPPDIIGPVGQHGIERFKAHLLPLDAFIARYGVDLSGYDEAALRPYRNEDGCLIALPYAVFPSFIYYNKDLFDAAGLPYPPQRVGEQYEGQPWDMDALRELGMRLTLDAGGRNATEPGFDPSQIVQFGFVPQWVDSAINEGAFFGAGDLTGPDNQATIPDAWQAAWRWFHRARHVDHFVPDAAYAQRKDFGQGNVWSSGKAAMAWTHLWYTCCFTREQVPRWDIAAVPSYQGQTTAKLHADTFAITWDSQHQEEAFKAYLFVLSSPELRQIYGGLPALKADQPGYFAQLDARYAPNRVTWQVALDSLAYADIPSHDGSLPNHLKTLERLAAFDRLRHARVDLDLDGEIQHLERDLTSIFREE